MDAWSARGQGWNALVSLFRRSSTRTWGTRRRLRVRLCQSQELKPLKYVSFITFFFFFLSLSSSERANKKNESIKTNRLRVDVQLHYWQIFCCVEMNPRLPSNPSREYSSTVVLDEEKWHHLTSSVCTRAVGWLNVQVRQQGTDTNWI